MVEMRRATRNASPFPSLTQALAVAAVANGDVDGPSRVNRLVVDGERTLVRVDVACAQKRRGKMLRSAARRFGSWLGGCASARCVRASPANTMFTLAACSIGSSVWRMSSPSPLAGREEGERVGGRAGASDGRPSSANASKTHWCALLELYHGA